MNVFNVQYRHLILAPIDRMIASDPVVQTPMETCQKIIPSTLLTYVSSESKLHVHSFVRSYMHPCPGTWIASGLAVVYHSRAAQAFSTGIICRHCILSQPESCAIAVMYSPQVVLLLGLYQSMLPPRAAAVANVAQCKSSTEILLSHFSFA